MSKERFGNCAVHGVVRLDNPQDWGDEIAEFNGSRIVTGECPDCHSTLSSLSLEQLKEIWESGEWETGTGKPK